MLAEIQFSQQYWAFLTESSSKEGDMQRVISKTEPSSPPRPMLAQHYKAFPKGMRCFSQPKLDGVRCVATAGGLYSRNGIRIQSCGHIEEALRGLFAEHPDLVLDGELYNHELRDDLGAIISLVNRQPAHQSPMLEKSEVALSLHVFDVVDVTSNFSERLVRCRELASVLEGQSAVRFVDTIEVTSLSVFDALYARYLDDGYEGAVARIDAPYIGARSSRLLKRKPFEDAEFELVGLERIGSGQRAGLRARLKTECDQEFAAVVQGAAIPPGQRLSLQARATVRFAGRSKNNIPRCAQVVAIHANGTRF